MKMESIGPHFFALPPYEQARRIVLFAESIWARDPQPTLRAFGDAMRRALRSMASNDEFYGVVRVRPQFVLIETSQYCISSAPESTFIVES
jgi:hypothetical protein